MAKTERIKIQEINQEVYSGKLDIREVVLDHDNWLLKLKEN